MPGRQHDDRRIVGAGRGHRAQVVEQQVGIVVDGRDAVAREQLGKQAHHHLAVFQHVGHAGGHAQIVFQHIELALAGPHDVDPGNVGVDVGGHLDALHFGAVLGVLVNLRGGNHAGLDDVLAVIDIVDEHVQRLDALHQARSATAPIRGRE